MSKDTSCAEKGLACVFVLVLLIGAILLGGLILMVVWNLVVPGAFNGPELTYLQALGLSLLLSIIGSYFKK